MSNLHLTTGSLELTFCDKTGALTQMTALETGWKIERREELGLSWRLLVPVSEELRNNPVYGEKQELSDVKVTSDAITFVWDGVMSERGGKLAIKITTKVAIEGRQAVWYTTVENKSAYMVESVYSPYLGDLNHPEGAKWFKTFLYSYASAQEWNLWPKFDNHEGYYGVDYPTQFGTWSAGCGAPMSPFFLMRSENQGLYAGIKASSEELVAWNCELRPGWGSSINQLVPEVDTIAGKPVHTLFAPVHMCYIQPNESRELTPVALEAYIGDWQNGVDIYKEWRDTWTINAAPPTWASEPHSWLQLHINSPEDELRLKFVDLPKVAAECSEHGVKAIQLVGWNNGGQDQGNPSHSPDPRLGTFEELKTAIAACQAMGVKIILFAKFVWADRGTEWFRDELINYAIKDPYDDYYMHGGYKYQTPAQLLDINTKRLIPMCFASEKFIDICKNEFKKLIELNCDGFLFDECLHHSPALLCFDNSHGHRYGWPVYQNDRKFIEDLKTVSGLREDFLFAGEAVYDWELEAYSLSYHRSENKKHIALSRYMRPHSQLMTAVTGFHDRNMINQCLLNRYIISYEPYNFKGWLHDYPDTLEYGKIMDALRKEYRKYFWDGEYRDNCGACVTTLDGAQHNPYSVFKAEDSTSALVICNYENSSTCVEAHLEGNAQLTKYRLIDEAHWKDIRGGIVIPARSAAIVI